MNLRPLPLLLPAALLLAPALARADRNPGFDEDAAPLLSQQPGLIDYVHSHFKVRATGVARVPGDANRPPQPPFLFAAKERGAHGPYNLTLLIQPGSAGHILKVIDRPLPSNLEPGAAQAPSQPQPPASTPAPAAQPQPAAPASAPTADTPSGPIMSDGASNLTPPPDTAPATH